MALRLVTDHGDAAFEATVQAVVPAQPVTLTAAEITGLVGLFQTMLDRTEKRILEAMAGNSERATERWAKHDAELERNTKRVVDRFAAIDARLQTTVDTLQAHLDREHDDDLVMQARVRPVQIGLAWAVNHWKDVVILVIGILGLIAVTADVVSRYLGGAS